MAHIPQSGIRTACDEIVDRWGPRGKAEEKLKELHQELKAELDTTDEWERQITLKGEVAFLEGYMETPAAKIADITATQKKIRR